MEDRGGADPATTRRIRQRVSELLKRGRGRNIRRITKELAPVLRSWASYCSLVDVKRPLEVLDSWIRRRLRCVIWRQWKRPKTRRRKILALGLDEHRAWKSAGNGRDPWWNAGASHMNQALPPKWFEQQGMISVLDTVRGLAVLHEPPYTERYVRWCGRAPGATPALPDCVHKLRRINRFLNLPAEKGLVGDDLAQQQWTPR